MPVEIHGVEYATVAERLVLAHGGAEQGMPPVGIQSVETQAFEVGGMVVCRALVTFKDGRTFTGMSLVKLDSRSPAERDAPLETCETSAVGRALAFAGYPGSEKGLAGAEELHLAQQRASFREGSGSGAAPRPVQYADGSSSVTRMPPPGTSSRLGGAGQATQKQIAYAERLLQDKRMPPPDDLTTMSSQDISRLIDSLRQG